MTIARSISILTALFFCVAAPLAADQPPTASEMARTIDQRFEAIWRHETLEPAQPCDASVFVRRATLDLAGRIPTAVEARQFAQTDSDEHRRELVELLSKNAANDGKLAATLRKIWFPQTDVAPYQYLSIDTERWIARQLRDRRPLNEIASMLIAVSDGDQPSNQANAAPNNHPPRTFIAANDHRPDRMADNAAGAFLGVDLSCAQCHDHPFGSWTQDQFWQTAAFFQRTPPALNQKLDLAAISIEIPDGDRQATAALFTGEMVPAEIIARSSTGRTAFANWVGDPNNPYFAKHTVNQFWEAYFGRPLVASVYSDSEDEAQLASLLSEIASAFKARQFDASWLVRAMLQTQAYQASSVTEHVSRPEVANRFFALAAIRGLSGEQLFDSLLTAAGRPLIREDIGDLIRINERKEFREIFQMANASQPQRSVTQTLKLMNGRFTEQLYSEHENATISALANAPFMSEDECITTLFQATLARSPSAAELTQLRKAQLHVNDQATRANRYRNVFWLLINTIEFNTNH